MTDPAWARTAGPGSYGGDVNKANYMNQGKIDALTDVGAEDINRIALDLSAVVRTAPFLVARLTQDDTGTDDPTVHVCMFQPSGVSTTDFAGDAPPTGFPTFTRQADGHIRVTFASSYSDDYSNSAATSILAGAGGIATSTAGVVTGEIVSATTIDFRTFDTSGSAATDEEIVILVY